MYPKLPRPAFDGQKIIFGDRDTKYPLSLMLLTDSMSRLAGCQFSNCFKTSHSILSRMPLNENAYVGEMLFAFIAEYLLRPETAFGGSFQISLPHHPVVIFETKNKSKLYKRKEENNY